MKHYPPIGDFVTFTFKNGGSGIGFYNGTTYFFANDGSDLRNLEGINDPRWSPVEAKLIKSYDAIPEFIRIQVDKKNRDVLKKINPHFN